MPAFFRTLVALLMGVFSVAALAHEGHDHGPPQPELQTVAAPRAEAQSDAFELVAVARDGVLTIYLDQFRTNEPVIGASIEIDTPQGPKTATAVEDRYRLDAPWSSAPGTYDLMFTVVSGGDADVLTASLVVPQPPATGAPAAPTRWSLPTAPQPVLVLAGLGFAGGLLLGAARTRRRRLAVVALALFGVAAFSLKGLAQDAPAPVVRDMARRLPDGAVFMPKPAQRLLEIRTEFTQSKAHALTVELPGRVIPDPNASGVVQAAVSGRLAPPEGGFPKLGARVRKGDVLAYVTPPLSAAETMDQRQRQGELDQQITLIQQRIARFEKLIASGAVARVQLDEARIELDAIRDRRGTLERMRREPEALVAPVSGHIASVQAVAGQIADTNAVVFKIVDPARLWVEALSMEALVDVEGAEARTGDGVRIPLTFEGSGLADKTQFLPIHFAAPLNTPSLRVGQLVSVFVRTRAAREGVAVPRASVLTGANGQSVVYEHGRAERFEPKEVRVTPLDASRVLVQAGLTPGRRIVVQGAELLNQVR